MPKIFIDARKKTLSISGRKPKHNEEVTVDQKEAYYIIGMGCGSAKRLPELGNVVKPVKAEPVTVAPEGNPGEKDPKK